MKVVAVLIPVEGKDGRFSVSSLISETLRGAVVEREVLQNLLQELHEALSEMDNKEHVPGEQLSALKTQVEKSLLEIQAGDPEALDHESLSRRLNNAIEVFEETHPKLTATLSDILRSLSRYGI